MAKSIILRAGQVTKMLGISKPTLWRWEQSGEFVPRIQLGSNMVGYLASDVEDWLRLKIKDNPDRITGCVARAMSEED